MTEILGLAVAPIILLSALGFGAAAVASVKSDLPTGPIGFSARCAIGIVILGWLGFLLLLFGLTSVGPFLAVVLCGLVAVWLCRHDLLTGLSAEFRVNRVIYTLTTMLFAVDMLSATMPVLDADSNAYHFTLPLQFLTRGELFLIPRAVDGAAPLLLQTVYAFGLKLGGETAMVSLAKLMVWLLVLLVYGILRRWTDAPFAAIISLILLTMPAVVYGMGSGQVETRISLLTLAAAWMIYMLWKQPTSGNAAMTGALCGGIAAAKYTGLLFAPAAGLAILLATRNPKLIGIALLSGLVAGGQWYAWLWIETGSPVFPILSGPPYWHPENQAAFAERILSHERAIPADLPGLFAYPFLAFWDTYPGFESGRTGAGPAVLALSPIAIIGAVKLLRERDRDTSAMELGRWLIVVTLCAITFYVLWWFFGASQRLRHLLPAVTLVLVLLALLSFNGAVNKGHRRLLFGLTTAVSIIQLGGWAFYHRPTIAYAMTGFDRQSLLSKNLISYDALQWMRRNLPSDALLVLIERENNFHIGMPFYRVSSDLERLVDIGSQAKDPGHFLRQVKAVGGTHILLHLLENPGFTVKRAPDGSRIVFHADIDTLGREGSGIGRYHQLVMKLLRDECAEILHESLTRRTRSRTLVLREERQDMVFVVGISLNRCPYADIATQKPINRIHTNWIDGQPGFIPGLRRTVLFTK